MKQVAANLNLLLTCPTFLLWHVLGAVICIPAYFYAWSQDDPQTGAWLAPFLIPIWSANLLTGMQRDILSSPASFCLPRHLQFLRRTSFLVGIITCLVAAVPVMRYPGLVGADLFWAVWSAFCFALIIYLLVVCWHYFVDYGMAGLGPVLIIGFALVEYPSSRMFVQKTALFTPFWNTLVLIVLAAITYKMIGRLDMARRAISSRFLSLQMSLWRNAAEEFASGRKRVWLAKNAWGVRERLLRLFFERINRHRDLSFRRHLAAVRYEWAGLVIPTTWGIALLIATALLAALVFVGYMPLTEDQPNIPKANIVYLASCFLALGLPIPTSTTLLLPVGRRRNFWTVIVMALSNGIMVLSSAAFLFIVLLLFSKLAPPIHFGNVYEFRPADLAPAFIPLVLLPANLVSRAIFKNWPLISEILLFLIASLVIVKAGTALNGVSLSVMMLLSWTLFVVVHYVISFRRDLVGRTL